MAIISGFRSHTDRTPLLFSGYQIFLRNLKNANKILLYVFWPLKIILSSILVDFFGQIQPSANITIPQTRECKCHKQLFFAWVLVGFGGLDGGTKSQMMKEIQSCYCFSFDIHIWICRAIAGAFNNASV